MTKLIKMYISEIIIITLDVKYIEKSILKTENVNFPERKTKKLVIMVSLIYIIILFSYN